MEYDLLRMGSTLFEDMSVALCSAEFGPGGTTFGVGADGGREWTYEGNLPMPENTLLANGSVWSGGNWNGYTVVQVKHKSFFENNKADLEWLLTTISKEVKNWLETKSGRANKPKNLLFITNVRLTPVPNTGGVDRIKKAMQQHALALKLDGWAVWSAVHVSRLLDNHRDIRKTYLAQITVGDVLSAVLEYYEGRNEESTSVITAFVAKELYAHRHVRLTRAGSTSERERESLAEIGIDLPAVDRNATSKVAVREGKQFVADSIIQAANSPSSPNRAGFMTVLIGGPGQGKSTIGQLLCQSYRAALLVDSRDNLSTADSSVLDETLAHLNAIGLPLPSMRRWPIYIRLTHYSEKLTEQGDTSIQAQIAEQINSRGGGAVTKGDINVWLSQWPWLVVLDGLDEVPDSHTRVRILQKVNEFVSDAANKKADIAILATTRPQGYQQDLAPHRPKELELIELNPEEALSYGKKLVYSRNTGDLARASELLARLESASQENSTAKLMGTPLQVSIMASLLEDRVRVPSTRYKLFDEFYETVYRRESSKEGKLGEVVEGYKAEIDSLHDGAGIRLHVESEHSGMADVHLSKADLRKIAYEHLVSVQTYSPSDAETTASKLVDLATDRLVLLVEESTDRWGYEIRSFQEFMAARFISEGDDELVLRRLKALSRSSHWRNTWLFAAARIFDSRPRLRRPLTEMLTEIDKETVADSIAQPGAHLASDLLIDNFASGTPGIRKGLVLQCVELLDNPTLNREVLRILDSSAIADTVVRRAIQDKLKQASGAGGRRAINIQKVMRYWSTNFVGSIATHIRQKMDRATVVEEFAPSGISASFSLGSIIGDSIDLSTLKADDYTAVRAALDEDSALFIRSDITHRLLAVPESHISSDILADLISSDEAFDIIERALERLPLKDAQASNWFIAQVAQTIGQRVRGMDEDLELAPGLVGGSSGV